MLSPDLILDISLHAWRALKGINVAFRKTAAWTVSVAGACATLNVVRVALLDIAQFASIHGVDCFRTIFDQNCLIYCLTNDELFSNKIVVNLQKD